MHALANARRPKLVAVPNYPTPVLDQGVHAMTTNGSPNAGGKPTAQASQPGASPFDKPAPEGSAQTVSQVLGEIVWLMSQSPMHGAVRHRRSRMARRGCDKRKSVMTPVILQQFRMFYQDAPPEQGGRRPIGVILWGTVSPEVDAMLTQGTNRLRPQDWKSGDKAWVVEVIAPFGGGDAMVADVKAKVFAGRELRALVMTDGRREVRVM